MEYQGCVHRDILFFFFFDSVADQQKSKWREEKLKKIHSEEFISRGLWSISRHPNYVGEVMLWASQVMIGWTALPGERITKLAGTLDVVPGV